MAKCRPIGRSELNRGLRADQAASGVSVEGRGHAKDRRNGQVLVEKLEALATTFDTIHTPHSRDQVGDDYAHSDDEWAAIKAEAKQAEAELPAVVRDCTLVLDRLLDAFDAEASRIRTQIRTTETALLGAKT